MPKEMIGTPTPNEPFELRVGWQRDMDVQVGVEHGGGRSMFWQLLEPYKSSIGREMVALVDDAKIPSEGWTEADYEEAYAKLAEGLLNVLDTQTGAYQGIWAQLDRKGCNDLIRVVRRARDAAFGQDE